MNASLRRFFPRNTQFAASLVPKIANSIGVIQTALSLYRSTIVVCFNGGKDATVLLDLVTRVNRNSEAPITIRPFYLQTPGDFGEMLSFLDVSERFWDVELLKLSTPSLKDGLKELIENYETKAVFLGVRNSDLRGSMSEFEKTSEGWPPAMRVSPILNWNYHDVWNYIEALGIPVCELYKKGFTSIGTREDTMPNPALWSEQKKGYMHARYLKNAEDERKGRSIARTAQ